jgi:uncharacterized protein YoxC
MLAIIASIIVTLAIVTLFVIFYFLNKRVDALALLLTSSISELQEKLKVVNENLQTLRQNDDILAKDIETLLHEFKDIEKKVKLYKRS